MQNVDRFKQLQQEMGATNSALSLMLGVSVATIEKRRAGKVRIAEETIIAMKHLKVNYGS